MGQEPLRDPLPASLVDQESLAFVGFVLFCLLERDQMFGVKNMYYGMSCCYLEIYFPFPARWFLSFLT